MNDFNKWMKSLNKWFENPIVQLLNERNRWKMNNNHENEIIKILAEWLKKTSDERMKCKKNNEHISIGSPISII